MRRCLTQVSAIALTSAMMVTTPGLASPTPPTPPTVAAILAANHAAVGQVPANGGAQFDYHYAGNGLTGTGTDSVDLGTGAFVSAVQADIVGEAHGFDGKTPWMRDTSGANTAQEGGDRIAVAINEAYRFANLWWRPDYGGATVVYAGRASVDGQTLDQLTITPRQGKPFGAWFDSSTHQLARITEDQQFFHKRFLFADYRRKNGLMVPHEITIDNGTGKESYESLRLTRFSLGAARPLSAYSRPLLPPTGATIDGGVASATVPFRLLNNHIYVQAKVNGKGPYTFIVDTGGHALIAPELVAELGLRSSAPRQCRALARRPRRPVSRA
jgi:hypothetical protein